MMSFLRSLVCVSLLAIGVAQAAPDADPALIQRFADRTLSLRIVDGESSYILHLALASDGTGWLQTVAPPAPPATRYVYRWWGSRNGELCLLHSREPAALNQAARWRCLPIDRSGAQPELLSFGRRPADLLADVPGNALADAAEVFLAEARAVFGPDLPAPPPPITRMPP